MIQKIAFVGATGNLAPYVYKAMVEQGYKVRAIVRNPEKLRAMPDFSNKIEVVKADLKDVAGLKKGFENMDAVYLNLATVDDQATFQPEIHGVKNIIEAAKATGIKRIFHVSAITIMYPEFANGANIFINDIRKNGYNQLIDSGIPCTFFHLSWMMEALDFAMRKGNSLNGFKGFKYPFYWLSARDLGDMVISAIELSNHNENRDYIMQGKKAVSLEDALNIYATQFTPALKVQMAPGWLVKMIGLFNKEAKLGGIIFDFFKNYKEELRAQATWDELGAPKRSLHDFKLD